MKLFNILLLFSLIFLNSNILSNEVIKKSNLICDLENKRESGVICKIFSFYKNSSNVMAQEEPLKLYNNFIVVGSVFTGCAGAFLTTGLIMGFIPINGSTEGHLPHSAFERNIFMTVYGSIGVSLIIVGSILLLFSLPLLIYGAVKKNIYLERNNESKKEFKIDVYSGIVSIKFH